MEEPILCLTLCNLFEVIERHNTSLKYFR